MRPKLCNTQNGTDRQYPTLTDNREPKITFRLYIRDHKKRSKTEGLESPKGMFALRGLKLGKSRFFLPI